MSNDPGQSRVGTVLGGLKTLVMGDTDPRLRAIWRVLLAGFAIVLIQEPLTVTIANVLNVSGRLPVGLVQATVFLLILLGWAMYIDRRPLFDYGFSQSGSWVVDGLIGFLAVLVGFGVWLGLGSVLGWATVEVALTAPEGSVLFGLSPLLLGTGLNVWVQETTFTGMVIKNGAEGLASRGVTATRAVIGAWVVAVLIFTVIHQRSGLWSNVNLLIVLGLYGLLYVQTGDLALPIGVHTGMNFAGSVIVTPSIAFNQPSLIEVTNSLSGVLKTFNDGAVPHVLIAYLLILGWLKLRHGEIAIAKRLTHWTKR